MKVDLPDIKRCCFCVPLRYGLIVAGYVKLAFILLVLVVLLIDLINYIEYAQRHPYIFYVVHQSVFILCLVLDISVDVVLVVGGHRKNINLLHIYYIYSIVMLCLFTTAFTLLAGTQLYYLGSMATKYEFAKEAFMSTIKALFLLGVLFIGTQMYMILLIRTEINKLKNNAEFRFTNVAAEAHCTLEKGTDEQRTDDQKEITVN